MTVLTALVDVAGLSRAVNPFRFPLLAFALAAAAGAQPADVLRESNCTKYERSLALKHSAVKEALKGKDKDKAVAASADAQRDFKACLESLKSKVSELTRKGSSRTSGTLAEALTGLLRGGPSTTTPLIGDSTVPHPNEPINRFLFRLHRLYQDIKHDEEPVVSRADRADAELVGDALHRLMDELRLREPFAAALDTGLTITDAGNTVIPYARSATGKLPFGLIDWESKHFFEHGRTDWSFGGRLGLLPALTLVNRSDEKLGADGNPVAKWPLHPLFQDAFHWDVNARFSVHTSESSELSLLGRAGQAQLLEETQAVGTQQSPVSTSLLPNGPGRSAWLWDVGPEFRMFDNPLDNVHEDKTYHSPVFAIGGGLRRNYRFRRDGPLTDFTSPEMRWFFRFSISLNKVIDRRAADGDPKTFSIGFAVEHEGPLRRAALASTVPSGTRIVLTANFDVLSKLRRAEAN